MKFADPRNDIAFKRIFGNQKHKEVLIHFVNATLDFPEGAKVIDVSFDTPYQVPKIEDLKETVLDVQATDQQGRKFIIEMQVQRDYQFDKRSLFYTSKSYVNQLEAGEQYSTLKHVHFIGILDFIFDFDDSHYLSNHLILNTRNQKNQLKDFAFCFIELPKFNKNLEELDDVVDQWVFFIKNAPALEEVPELYRRDDVFRTAFTIAQQHSWSKDEMEVYDYLSIRLGRERSQMETAHREGWQEGWQDGRESGRHEGEQIGLAKGERIGLEKAALALLKMGLTYQQVAAATDRSMAEIENLAVNSMGGPSGQSGQEG